MEFRFDDRGDSRFDFAEANNQYFSGNMLLDEISGLDDETFMTSFLQDLKDSDNPFFDRDFPSSSDCSSTQQVWVPPYVHSNGSGSMETSVEESVLQDFEALMAQLSDKVRLGFRDTFYRLASDSISSPLDLNQDDLTPRSGFEETSEINNVIANLMFDKMEANMKDFPVMNPSDPRNEAEEATRPAAAMFRDALE